MRRLGLGSVPLLLVAAFAVAEAIKLLTAPWAVEWLPGPKLVGTWEGGLRARQGAEYRVFLDLRYADERGPSRTGESNNLGGTASLCTRHGVTYDYEIYGGASWSGRDLHVRLTYGDPKRSGLGVTLRGTWDGDLTGMTSSHNPFDPDGAYRPETPSSTADPDDSFAPATLRRGTLGDFEAACRALAAGGR